MVDGTARFLNHLMECLGPKPLVGVCFAWPQIDCSMEEPGGANGYTQYVGEKAFLVAH